MNWPWRIANADQFQFISCLKQVSANFFIITSTMDFILDTNFFYNVWRFVKSYLHHHTAFSFKLHLNLLNQGSTWDKLKLWASPAAWSPSPRHVSELKDWVPTWLTVWPQVGRSWKDQLWDQQQTLWWKIKWNNTSKTFPDGWWSSHTSVCCCATTNTCCMSLLFWTMPFFQLIRECFIEEDRFYVPDGNFSDVLNLEKKRMQ